ncbi:ABC transporter ATP-binding protein [Micromonospora sp. C32]|nr:ABC transporter ATP-binding protein [Micromonospora sp. C72]MBQ1056875.1 ABC transporter ATP-binding protein [Micromonospora sp. C32]
MGDTGRGVRRPIPGRRRGLRDPRVAAPPGGSCADLRRLARTGRSGLPEPDPQRARQPRRDRPRRGRVHRGAGGDHPAQRHRRAARSRVGDRRAARRRAHLPAVAGLGAQRRPPGRHRHRRQRDADRAQLVDRAAGRDRRGARRDRVERRLAQRRRLGRGAAPVRRHRSVRPAARRRLARHAPGGAGRRDRARHRRTPGPAPPAAGPGRRGLHRDGDRGGRAGRVHRARRAPDRPTARTRRGRTPGAGGADRRGSAARRRSRRAAAARAGRAAGRRGHHGDRRLLSHLAARHGGETTVTSRLIAEDVTLGYGERVVSTRVSLAVPDGRFTAIVGPNACGKSTLLKAFVRLLTPASGAVRLDGRGVAEHRPKPFARQVGFLPQGLVAPENITVRRLVSRGRYPHQSLLGAGTAADEEAVRSAMAVAGVTDLAERPVEELSGGQRQRVWIAMVLAQQTPYLLLDEPTTFLDITHQYELLALFAKLRDEGRTVVAVLHDINQACRFADHIVAMKAGRIVAQGPPAEVVDAGLMREVFGLPSMVMPNPVTGTPMVVPTV